MTLGVEERRQQPRESLGQIPPYTVVSNLLFSFIIYLIIVAGFNNEPTADSLATGLSGWRVFRLREVAKIQGAAASLVISGKVTPPGFFFS